MSKKYDTFAAYLEDVYYNQIFSKIKSYLFNNKGRLDLSTSVVPDPSYVELSDFKIMGVNFHESDTDRIECKVTVRAEIEISGRGRRDYESDSTECWISIPLSATLRNGLQQVSIGYASEYSRELFRAEDALTKYLVPYIYAKDLDKHAERFLEKYCPRALEEPMPLPIKEIVEKMGLTVYHAPLPDGIFGRTYFNDANVEVFTNKTCSETEDRTICPGTILVNPDVVFMRNIGSTNNTIIHECVHWDKHYKFFELQKLLNPDIQAISCAVVEDYKKKSNELEDELSWMEWQANALAPKILIPAKTGKAKLSEILNRLHRAYRGRLRDGYVMELAISEFADFFKVSTTAAKIRAVELGFEQAAGVFNFVDGKNYPPFSFKKGSLKKGQTFVIDRNNVIIQSLLNPDLSEDIAARRFIHAGGLLVINDPQYVSIVEDSEPTLTEYALEHVDECCLVFDRTTRVSTQYDDSFYRICFLCRDADSKSFVEASFNPKEGKNEDVQKRAREMAAIAAEAKRVADILAEVPSSFCGALDYHIKRRGYSKHGFNIHGVVFDELHTQPNRKLFDVMTKGSGDARMQPLYFLITTAGTDTKSICYETHQKAKDIIEGRKIDPTFYPVIYGADENDDWTDPKVWKKANPSLGITVGIDKVKAACESAKQNPAEENSFRQLRLNQWVKQAVRWMPMEKWDRCAFATSEDDLEGRVCYGGLDLSSTTDITAFVLVFPPMDEDDKFVILPYFWIPEENIDQRVNRDHVPYDVWERQGFLQTTEGNVVHYGYIEKFIERLGERFNIREIAFDRWGAVQMVQNLEGMGFTVVPFGQGFKDMSPPTKELMKLVLEERIAHGGHPVLRWMMDNIYVRTDPAGNIKPDKEKSTEKIDGAVATVMALDRAIRCGNDTTESVYDTRGLLFL